MRLLISEVGRETDDEIDRTVETVTSFSELEDTLDAMLNLVRSEHACHGNYIFVEKVWDSKVSSLQFLLKDARSKRRSRQVNKTWASRNHPASLFSLGISVATLFNT